MAVASNSHSSRAAGARSAGRRVPCVLSIAGSDSGGGAGIQADLKAFARCGVHGMTAITAVTAQNTVAVTAIHPVPAELILAQVRAVRDDLGVDAVKVGMLATAEIAVAVVQALRELPDTTPVVVDPVMVAESGARLLDAGAEAVLIERLLPLATVVTPNLPEAGALARGGCAERSRASRSRPAYGPESEPAPEVLARAVHSLGPRAVVITGGHREQNVDLYFDGVGMHEIAGERHPDGAAHGSGCTHSSALAAHLALGMTPLAAARAAKEIASQAVRDGLSELGRGAGPVDVFGLRMQVTQDHLP
jgi:hydroxymethylpyrimidine/phosphomethylpyrimidine kinase